MSFTYRENRNSPLTWSQLDGNFREVEAVQVEASNQALAAAASAETANQASESASLSSGQAEDYASLAEEMARISVVRWCGNHEEAPSTRLDGSPLQISDEYGNLSDNLRYNWTGTSWVALNSSAQELEVRLASPTGSNMSGFTQDGQGAIAETIQGVLRSSRLVSTKRFGALCDGATNDTQATLDAIDHVRSLGGGTVLIDGISVIEATLFVPFGVTLKSLAKGYEKTPAGGLLFRGTGPKTYSIAGATAISVANPDAGSAYLADSGTRGDAYSTLDLSIPFSVGVILDKGAQLVDCGIYPWFDGVAGYAGTDGRLSDDWDVGVWCRNASGWRTTDIIVDGHWRKAGLLVSSADAGDGKIPQCELGQALNCNFGGFRGVAIRAPRNASGGSNYGFAGTDFINCFIRSLNHQSLHLATSSFLTTPFTSPSACLEMDGSTVLRGIQFLNCTRMGRDDINVISDFCSEIRHQGSYAESKEIKVGGAWMPGSVGSRMVATANSKAVFETDNTKYAVDFSPYFTRDSSLATSRYNPAKTGVFSPLTAQDGEWERPNFSTSYGIRLRSSQVFRLYDSGFVSKFSVTESGVLTTDGNITINKGDAGLYAEGNPLVRRYASGTVQLANGVYSAMDGTMTNPGIIRHSVDNVYSFGSPTFRATVVYATTATINVSDERHKSQIQEIPDLVLDAWEQVGYSMYKFNDAVELKDDGARWHFGVVAQRVKEAFESFGLDPFAYGAICYDQWEDQYIPVIEQVLTYDNEGNEHRADHETGERKLILAAGNRYGIRYEEALCLEVALTRRTLARQEEKTRDILSSMEARIVMLENK